MGDAISKLNGNICIKENESATVPKFHFKCRYDPDDEFCDKIDQNQIFTRTKDIKRFTVPREKVKWDVEFLEYKPVNFTSEKIKTRDTALYKDPDLIFEEYRDIEFNKIDKKYNCDRTSHHGPYKFLQFNDKNILAPCNPVGRTGIIGRGHLGRWGPNHAADPIVTQWKRDANNKIVKHPKTNKPILQFVAIRRRDTKEFAIPGGMRDPGEYITKTLIREFTEEALSRNLKFDTHSHQVNTEDSFDKLLAEFFRNGLEIYKGYVDDPRNTDNAWMETIACNFHDETSKIVGNFKLQGGDDAEHATWLDLSSDLLLYASHADFLREVAFIKNAHW